MAFPLNDSVQVSRSANGEIQRLDHIGQPYLATPSDELRAAALEAGAPSSPAETAQDLANDYLREVAPLYGFSNALVPNRSAALEEFGEATPEENRLHVEEEKQNDDATAINYQQTYRGIPVWNAGTSVTILASPMRVTSSESTVRSDITLSGPETGPYEPATLNADSLKKVLGLPPDSPLHLHEGARRFVFRFEAADRVDPAVTKSDESGFESAPPALQLPPVPAEIEDGKYYVVTEANFRLPTEQIRDLNWVAFVEVAMGTVLYLRSRAGCATGMVFTRDPFTGGHSGGLPSAGAAVLNPFRERVTLLGVNGSVPSRLAGNFVEILDVEAPTVAPPTVNTDPAEFHYDAPSREFAAVNAYHHCDGLFRQMEEMGINVTSYFDGTTFPVRVDPCAFNDQVNALAPGTPSGRGSDGFRFGLAGAGQAVSIAADVRVALHEFGHALLWDHVHWPNFGFAHSAGDSLAAILMDPDSALRDDPVKRFNTFPWVLPKRRHDRSVADGFGWDGANYNPFGNGDALGYIAEQILATTLFRFYRAIGGDADDLATRKKAARRAVYLIFRAIGSLPPRTTSPTNRPESFATALMNADIAIRDFEGYKGGALHKVIRWAFEKQGLYQLPGTPRPVTQPGAAPVVDVFIEDGRHGEYDFQAGAGDAEIWNRHASHPGTGPEQHQVPQPGTSNFLYARIRNRGSQPAQDVQVRAFSADSSSEKTWPGSFTRLGGTPFTLSGPLAPGAIAVAGPFEWTPRTNGGETILTFVSATGDLSNFDARTFFPCTTGPTSAEEVVRFDNNAALRTFLPA